MQGGTTLIRRQHALHLHLRRYLEGIEPERREVLPVYADTITDGLTIALHPREANFEFVLLRQRMHAVAFWLRRRTALVLLERHHLKRYAKYLGDLLRQLAIIADIIAGAPQSASNNLLTQKLRHERTQADDVSDGVTVPPFGEHAHADDAADIASGRVQRTFQTFRQFDKALGIDWSSLRIERPLTLA